MMSTPSSIDHEEAIPPFAEDVVVDMWPIMIRFPMKPKVNGLDVLKF